ncbi:sensor histidine kinase [Ferdinandcohnia quinoae]|uniref:histidine kinase n=1 Tax=Fredinandcohnia quinoae TaxID=2918902 RepID=A0AAW5EAE9_9BACI|nr:HAMP domain-containing sensor histidine kinase [Fredinandcohnia sp. SECRCQ15]MCH1627006.1 HAMP domain-containing histidine kinase [Fredinandcohnia sp. SECRCQ15]
MEITKHFFFNLSLIIIVLFIGLIWSERKRNLTISKWEAYIWCVALLWTCFQFSYQPTPNFHFDLRLIPVLIGGLYLGIGPILSLTVIVIRAFYGIDSGFYATILLYLPLAFILWRSYPRFWRKSPSKRICLSIIIAIFLSILNALGMEFFTPPANRFDAWFAYVGILPIGIGIISYIIEFVSNNLYLRQTLIKSEKLQAVEQMGAAISHEIRNPLTAAMGFVQLLKENNLPRLKQKEYLSIIKEELASAEQVIQDYLTFSKPSLETIERLNVKQELNQVINILKPTANQNSVEIITNFEMVGSIEGDRQKFHQCFLNVLKNAIESMPRGGQLFVETQYHKSQLTILVRDTGVGMTIDQLERLGEPYYSTKGSKGTGLGMMVVYSIVKAMNGAILCESEIGVGTVFKFTFPTVPLSNNIV